MFNPWSTKSDHEELQSALNQIEPDYEHARKLTKRLVLKWAARQGTYMVGLGVAIALVDRWADSMPDGDAFDDEVELD